MLDDVTTDRPSTRRLLQRSSEVILHSGTFSFEVSPGAFDVPQSLFEQPEPVAVPNPDGLYLCAGATIQIIQCTYEVWDSRPVELPVTADSEAIEVVLEFGAAVLHLWGAGEVDSAVPLPHAGRYRAGVRVVGRDASRVAYDSGLERPVTGIESWIIRFWPV